MNDLSDAISPEKALVGIKAYTRQQKIDMIYEVVADKTLSPGYLYRSGNDFCEILLQHTRQEKHRFTVRFSLENVVRDLPYDEVEGTPIGHSVMIGDILDWLWTGGNDKLYNAINIGNVTDLWHVKRKPIEDQSDECIDFIYSLIDQPGPSQINNKGS